MVNQLRMGQQRGKAHPKGSPACLLTPAPLPRAGPTPTEHLGLAIRSLKTLFPDLVPLRGLSMLSPGYGDRGMVSWGGGRRLPHAAGEGSGGFCQRRGGKSSKAAASSGPQPTDPRHLAETGARVLGKLTFDLGGCPRCTGILLCARRAAGRYL